MHPKTRPSLSALASRFKRFADPIIAKAPAAQRATVEQAGKDLQTELDRLMRLPSHRGQRRKQSDFRSELQVNEKAALERFEGAARQHRTLKGAARELGLSVHSLHACIRDRGALSYIVDRLRTDGVLQASAGPGSDS